MNKYQLLLKKWIDKNFEDVMITFEEDKIAVITDYKQDTMRITLNEYYDIIEIDTDKVLAVSDLDHEEIPDNIIPQTWRELPYR